MKQKNFYDEVRKEFKPEEIKQAIVKTKLRIASIFTKKTGMTALPDKLIMKVNRFIAGK